MTELNKTDQKTENVELLKEIERLKLLAEQTEQENKALKKAANREVKQVNTWYFPDREKMRVYSKAQWPHREAIINSVRKELSQMFIVGDGRKKLKNLKQDDHFDAVYERMVEKIQDAARELQPNYPLRFEQLTTNFKPSNEGEKQILKKRDTDEDFMILDLVYDKTVIGTNEGKFRVSIKVWRDDVVEK